MERPESSVRDDVRVKSCEPALELLSTLAEIRDRRHLFEQAADRACIGPVEARMPAVTALSSEPAAWAAPLLERLIADPVNDIRLAAYGSLIALKRPGLLDLLRRSLESPIDETRRLAQRSLRLLGDRGAAKPRAEHRPRLVTLKRAVQIILLMLVLAGLLTLPGGILWVAVALLAGTAWALIRMQSLFDEGVEVLVREQESVLPGLVGALREIALDPTPVDLAGMLPDLREIARNRSFQRPEICDAAREAVERIRQLQGNPQNLPVVSPEGAGTESLPRVSPT